MRLFFVNFHRLWGGQSNAVVTLATEMARRGHDVLVAGIRRSELVRRAASAGLATYDRLELRRGFRPVSFLRDQDRLGRIWSSFRPQGILSNGSQDTWACAVARRRLRPPAFFARWRHNTFPVASHAPNRWLYQRMIDHVVVSSMTIAPLLTRNGLVQPERITVFSPTTDLERFLRARPGCGIREELGVDGGGLLAVCVGRLAPEKAPDSLIRAWRKVVDRLPDAHLAIAGTGNMEGALKQLIIERKLSRRVHLLGFRDDVPGLYAESDLAVLTPTAGESFGIALLEAFACGRACVATDVGGVKEMVLDGRTGFLVRPGDEDAIAAALVKALRSEDLRTRMGHAGKQHVLANFTPQKLGDVAEALFMRLAKRCAQKRQTV